MSQRIRLSVARLLDVAGRLEACPGAGWRDLAALLLGDALDGFDAAGASRINNDGSPLQLSLSSSAGALRVRVIADPCAGTGDRTLQRARATAALRRVLAARAPGLLPAALHTLDAVVPRPGRRHGGVGLDEFTSGIVWLGAAGDAPGAACYVDVRPHGDGAFALARSWLAALLPDGAAASATLDRLCAAGELASVGLEGYALADARAKLYLRLRDPAAPLAALGVPLLDSPAVHAFLAAVLGGHDLDREGLLLGVGFRLADGALADVKVDVCGHCLPYAPHQWDALVARVARRFDVRGQPLERALAEGASEVAFLGLGLDVAGRARLNTYLKADPAGGPVTAERLHAALADGVDGLVAVQAGDGAWRDYQLPVGASDQWVTAYAGHALALAAGRLRPAAGQRAGAAARRAAAALEHLRYPAGWGYNATTGPDCDSTAFALRLFDLVGRTPDPAHRAFLAAHWRAGGGFATYREASGWGAAHPDVTAAAFAALRAGEQRERLDGLRAFLARTRRADGLWPSYWWRGPYYATYQVLGLLAALPAGAVALPPPERRARLAPRDAFELACVVGIGALLGAPGAAAPAAARPEAGGRADRGEPAPVAALLALQRLDGRWPPSPSLRVTDALARAAADDAPGRCYADLHGTVTTATALEVLARLTPPAAVARRGDEDVEAREEADAALVP